jgi:hypothetical protein
MLEIVWIRCGPSRLRSAAFKDSGEIDRRQKPVAARRVPPIHACVTGIVFHGFHLFRHLTDGRLVFLHVALLFTSKHDARSLARGLRNDGVSLRRRMESPGRGSAVEIEHARLCVVGIVLWAIVYEQIDIILRAE